MHSSLLIPVALLVVLSVASAQFDDDMEMDKRAMRNALVRFGRSGGGMRNALVRFGKRSDPEYESSGYQDKRNGAPQPFVRFGRSGHVDHMHDILSTLQKISQAQ